MATSNWEDISSTRGNPTVSIYKNGMLGVNTSAVKAFGLNEYVYGKMRINTKEKMLGIKFLKQPEDGSFKLVFRGATVFIGIRKLISGYKLAVQKQMPKFTDDMLVINYTEKE